VWFGLWLRDRGLWLRAACELCESFVRIAATAPHAAADGEQPIGEVIDLDRVRRRDLLGGPIRELSLEVLRRGAG